MCVRSTQRLARALSHQKILKAWRFFSSNFPFPTNFLRIAGVLRNTIFAKKKCSPLLLLHKKRKRSPIRLTMDTTPPRNTVTTTTTTAGSKRAADNLSPQSGSYSNKRMFVSIEVRLAAAQMKYDFKVKLQTFLSESHAQMLKVKMRKTVEQNKYVMKRLDTREYDAITKEIEACTLHVRFLMNQMIQVNREVQARTSLLI